MTRIVTHHRIERGNRDRAGQFVVVKIQRTLKPDGKVAQLIRTPIDTFWTQARAEGKRLHLDRALALAEEADRLSLIEAE